MKGIRLRTFIIFALASLAGAALLHTSQNVQQSEERLATLQSEIQKEKDMIHVLNTEWEYLNRPERLERLAEEFLDLVPPAPDQMTNDVVPQAASLPERSVSDASEVSPIIPVSSLHGSSVQSSSGEMDHAHKMCDDVSCGMINDVPVPQSKPSALKSRAPQKRFDTLLHELNDEKGGAQ